MIDPESYRYRWVILLLASVTGSLTWGLAYTIGVFYISWIDEFKAGHGEVAVIGGINAGVASLLGPIYDVIHRRLGYRKAGALGGFIMTFGYVGSSFANNLIVLNICYGFAQGIGFGLAYFGAAVAINKYFFRQRTMAEGVVSFGAAAGGFCYTMMSQHLINTYGWRGALLIIGAITFHLLLFFQILFSPGQLKYLRLNWKSRKHDNELHHDDESTYAESDDIANTRDIRTWMRHCLVLFRNPLFLLMLIVEVLCQAGQYVPFVHLPERARLLGVNTTLVAWIASSISLAMGLGRLVIPGICSARNIDPFYAYGFTNVVAGLLTALSPFLTTELGILCYAIFFGLFGPSAALIRASAALHLGSDTFSIAYGWIIAMNGAGLLIGPALTGLMYDVTQSYDATFYTAGTCLIVSGVLVAFRDKAKEYKNAPQVQFRPAGYVNHSVDLPGNSSRQSRNPISTEVTDGIEPGTFAGSARVS